MGCQRNQVHQILVPGFPPTRDCAQLLPFASPCQKSDHLWPTLQGPLRLEVGRYAYPSKTSLSLSSSTGSSALNHECINSESHRRSFSPGSWRASAGQYFLAKRLKALAFRWAERCSFAASVEPTNADSSVELNLRSWIGSQRPMRRRGTGK